MKNARAIGMLIVSIVLGLTATALAVGWVSQKGITSNKVVVAAMDIELGSKLNPQMLSTVDWPSGSSPQGTFADLKDLQDRVVKTSIQRGEAILSAKLAPLGTQGGLSAVIADGKRAMTVRVNDVVGVAGFALPGNYVDVMVNAQLDKEGRTGEGKQISKTVLEHVLVLAVAQEAGRDDTKPKVVNAVTLELTLEDAERLDLARNVGTLSLVLRNQVDKLPVTTAGVTKKQLFGDNEEPIAKVADRKPVVKVVQRRPMSVAYTPTRACVEVIQNNTRALNCF
ncbi:Flp pilus assembly protein RcpC/CpaB [Georgfuchsia toluolica]|uniref:Flp pilus assembly protein RcpC/CpaB n=1 Tax=Georgfuchsia toluolica TaxID=424218 RepID=A0A916N1P4_9PROT|nr:Flp pilus assembly protein CpaB [Georgfuchsia toluolica]CAG4882907.1 Flp pilus assembly protein RcpC/CpaB [Georgfuchsia toluolica]